ncbi:uncharacterized protein LOC106665816 isoform X4 [Cimex lectularius]|uniref:Uncharacterized protein n=1 Tax=Cimex lectularius TaxID=79782 RepID=A0A8I6SN31_CIMLE|nr:uncharacterized protein LOC106665816 isoform X4 [Cimex lectularius]XP_024084728.1 uncharacterized protein LOC106665816 isoform X4 [Cimex lectularius]
MRQYAKLTNSLKTRSRKLAKSYLKIMTKYAKNSKNSRRFLWIKKIGYCALKGKYVKLKMRQINENSIKNGMDYKASLDRIIKLAEGTKQKINSNIMINTSLEQSLGEAKMELNRLKKEKQLDKKEKICKKKEKKVRKLREQMKLLFLILKKKEKLCRIKKTLAKEGLQKKKLLKKMETKLVYSEKTMNFLQDLNCRVFGAIQNWKQATNKFVKFHSYYQYIQLVVTYLEHIANHYRHAIRSFSCKQDNIQLISNPKNNNNSCIAFQKLTINELRSLLKEKLWEIKFLKKKIVNLLDLETMKATQRHELLQTFNNGIDIYNHYLKKDQEINDFIWSNNYFSEM